MSSKVIVVVEDREAQRESFVLAFRMRGFEAYGAATVSEARTLVGRLGDKIDVLVLDMMLDDPVAPNITGADIGIEVASKQKWPPEFLIISAKDDNVPYYQSALHLRAAAYLSKGKVPQTTFIQHVRALALRHALSARPETMDKITRIAEDSRDPAEAVGKFCREVLEPELSACLGTPFVILLTEGKVTRKCGGTATLPDGEHAAYEVVQSLAHGDANLSQPFTFNPENLAPHQQEPTSHGIYERLRGGAFLPLPISRDLLLSIGILEAGSEAENDQYKLAEDPREFAILLAGYFRPAALEFLLALLSRLTEFNAERKTVLRETSRFCLYVGQEQLAILADALEAGEVSADSEFFRRMKSLATDLRSTGELLLPLAVEKGEEAEASHEPAVSAVPLAEVVQDAWEDVSEQFPTGDISLNLRAADTFSVEAGYDDLLLAFSRLFQWTAQRRTSTPFGVQPGISVSWEKKQDTADIIIEDRSRRLGKVLRDHLFEPFNQAPPPPTPAQPNASGALGEARQSKPGLYLPLYLAKMLVEMKCHGKLQDSSDVMGGDIGHRFVVSLPLSESKRLRKGA
jgi:DNA-binding NarL/FixJ family response regulator/signal transduction histidine kinase